MEGDQKDKFLKIPPRELPVCSGHKVDCDFCLPAQRDPPDQESWEGFQHMLGTMLQMMWTQASGAPSGNHGLFHRFHIEALTIEGVYKKKGHRNFPLEQVARWVVIEAFAVSGECMVEGRNKNTHG